MQQILQAADSMASALGQEIERTHQARDMNEAVMETLPEKDQRGTLDWWGAFCRQYTGRSFLDSGGIYGYTFEQPIAPEPLYLNTYHGKPEYFSISTPHFLHKMLDATDEVAVAIEELLYWYGDNVAADKTWCQTDDEFTRDVLPGLFSLGEEFWMADVGVYLKGLSPQHFNGPSRWDKAYGLPEDWDKTFPQEALRTVARAGSVEPGHIGGGNTYNWDNDLDQVLQFESVTIVQGYRHRGDHYAVAQAHTGCDVRGGYTKPVVARMYDYEYFLDLSVRLGCGNCYADFERSYDYNKALEREGIENNILLVDGKPLDPEGGSVTVPYHKAQLLCPHCGEYKVWASSPVLGF